MGNWKIPCRREEARDVAPRMPRAFCLVAIPPYIRSIESKYSTSRCVGEKRSVWTLEGKGERIQWTRQDDRSEGTIRKEVCLKL